MSRASTQRQPDYDVLIIGGGINGAGIARDAAGRGFSVCLCDAGDFGGGTSSASTKLVHGGLRYLEHYEFRLVRKALMEREVLWGMAPHIIRPMRFILPHHKGLRPAWLLRLGLFLYDHLGGRDRLPGTKMLDLRSDPAGRALKPEFRRGFEYSDCWIEDSRMVILNLRDAEAKGARIDARTAVVEATHDGDRWNVRLRDGQSGEEELVTASVVVNATGPWIDDVLKSTFGLNNVHNVRLVRGSHIVVPRKFEHDRPYLFQNADDRIIFAIPYEDDFTLIGTTDAEHGETMTKPEISPEEISYLCAMASEYFAEPVLESDIVWTYSGVRPLFDDGASKAQEATRDYVIRRNRQVGDGTLINIFGGKITTFRQLAEAILEEIEDVLGERQPKWTKGAALPGGNFPVDGLAALTAEYRKRFAFLDAGLVARLVRTYGTDTDTLLSGVKSPKDLGVDFGAGLHEAEVRYLMAHEWARMAEDVVFRRTKLGIRMTKAEIGRLQNWMTGQVRREV